jgi:hypothetical protein
VFLMEVTDEAPNWPERQLRQREWLNTAETLDRLGDEGLRGILRAVAERHFPDQLPV